jgi:hypothetical protein
LKEDGSVVTWGSSSYGGDSSTVASELSDGISSIYSTTYAFAALKEDGSVVTWGSSSYGGDSSTVASELSDGISSIYSNDHAFVALKEDGSVVTWGSSSWGGDSSTVASKLSDGISSIYSTTYAFVAIKRINYSANEYNLAVINSKIDGQQEVINDPAQFSLHSDLDFTNAINSSREYGRNDVLFNPSEFNLYSLQDMADLRLGSSMIQISNNQATVQLQMQESSDLQTWEDKGDPATMTIPADTDTKFFRFKMTE